jgi:hypothetical protein
MKGKTKMLIISNSGSAEKTVIHLDKYSKTVLTVIASCLVLIAVNLYFSPKDSSAYEQVQDVNIRSINGSSISGGYLPVDLVRIDGSSSKEIRVDLRSINGRSVFGDKVPVDIQGVNGQFFIGGDLPVRVR